MVGVNDIVIVVGVELMSCVSVGLVSGIENFYGVGICVWYL